MASLKSVKKWESPFSCSLEKKIESGKVVILKCKMCIKYKERIMPIKRFSRNWIVGTSSVKKDSLEKQIKGHPHKYAANIFNKKSMGLSSFADEIVKSSPIGHGLTKMATPIKKSWKIILTQLIIWPKKEDHTVIFLI